MHPYKSIRLAEYPDKADSRHEGRASRIAGRAHSRRKHECRRWLKRRDRARNSADRAVLEWLEELKEEMAELDAFFEMEDSYAPDPVWGSPLDDNPVWGLDDDLVDMGDHRGAW